MSAALANERNRTPGVRSTLVLHAFATLLLSSGYAVLWMMPVLARQRFTANDWQTLLITAAGPTLLILSIFWNQLYERATLPRYLLAFWCVGVLPLLGIAAAQNYWHLLAGHLAVAVGQAGWSPVNGHLLKQLYSDAVRGRAFGVLNAATLVGAMAAGFGIGAWLELDAEAFRTYLPLTALAQGGGLLTLRWVARRRGATGGAGGAAPGGALATLRAALGNMGVILRRDPAFRRYEQAFMTYGVGWMICNSLLPVFTDVVHRMSYYDYAKWTQVTMQFAMLLCALPFGWVLDRLGPARTSALAFAGLAAYPLGLLASAGPAGVGVASAAYGAMMAGVQLGWMLGPVALARTAAEVPQYVAIHTTLVGLRGIVAQGLGMLIYKLTGSFVWPLVIAALAFAWSAQQMWGLGSALAVRRAERVVPPPSAAVVAASSDVE